MKEIGLQDLIYQVKRELLVPNPRERHRDPYPLFVIDKIELEISVDISQSIGGEIKLSVLNFAEIRKNQSTEINHGHVVKISLSPLLTKDALLREIFEDPEKLDTIKQHSRQAFVKLNDQSDYG